MVEFNLNEDPSFNDNGTIQILNYEDLIKDNKFCNYIISFCTKYGLPYYTNYEEYEIREANYQMICDKFTTSGKVNGKYDFEIKAKDLIFTSITI